VQWILSEMNEGGFNEKVGANERPIEIYDQWSELRRDTQRFRIRRHDSSALGHYPESDEYASP